MNRDVVRNGAGKQSTFLPFGNCVQPQHVRHTHLFGVVAFDDPFQIDIFDAKSIHLYTYKIQLLQFLPQSVDGPVAALDKLREALISRSLLLGRIGRISACQERFVFSFLLAGLAQSPVAEIKYKRLAVGGSIHKGGSKVECLERLQNVPRRSTFRIVRSQFPISLPHLF